MKPKSQSLIYTILADELPVVVFEATAPEARELCREEWLIEDLSARKVNGEPIHKRGTRLRARPAVEDEWVRYDKARKAAPHSAGMLLLYLVPIDGE
jgi:hypothetical protein